MFERLSIALGLSVFVAVMTFPFWYNIGSAAYVRPKVEIPKNAAACVEPGEWMRKEHMQLLNEWRDMVVRDGIHEYKSRTTGKVCQISLSKTCMKCHENKEAFCDRCHNSVSVSPYCWDCHVAPAAKEGK